MTTPPQPQSLTAVPGLHIGHATLGDTGCTVIVAPQGAWAAVDQRGGGPGTRETDLLRGENTVDQVHAICLSGGSAFGLAAADGVMAALAEHGIGFPVTGDPATGPIVPIVPAAVIFDLFVGDPNHRPTAADGYAATVDALAAVPAAPPAQTSSVGAGTAATAGKIAGGFGQAATRVPAAPAPAAETAFAAPASATYTVATGIVVNPMGSVIDDDGYLWGTDMQCDRAAYDALPPIKPGLNTTIGVVATDAPLTHGQLHRLAMVAHDGLARAIRPVHSPLDGDTIFALSTTAPAPPVVPAPSAMGTPSPGAQTPPTAGAPGGGVDTATMLALCAASAEVTAAAIRAAVTGATSANGVTAFTDLQKGSLR